MKCIAVLRLPKAFSAITPKAQAIVDAMDGNPHFVSPHPPLATIRAAIDAYAEAQAATLLRAMGSTARRNERLVTLRNVLERLRGYVQAIADDHPEEAAAIVTSAGMSVKGPPLREKSPLVAKPGHVSGSAELVAKAVAKRAVYEWQYSEDGDRWVDMPHTLQANTVLVGLTPERRYFFRVRAVTKTGAGEHGQVVSLLVP